MSRLSVAADGNTCFDERPVFIAGFPRTGTTLLFRILSRHSAFRRDGSEVSDDSTLVESQFYRRFFSPALELWNRTDEATLRTWFGNESARYTRFLIDCFRSFHIESALGRGAPRILDKTPDNLLILRLIVNAFPDARVLCLQRDPVDTLASFRRRRALQPDPEGSWLDVGFDIPGFIEIWNRQSEIWRSFLDQHPKSGHVVSFPALTEDPRGELKGVLQFIGRAFAPEILSGETPTRRTSPLDGYNSHVPVANSGDWEDRVEPAEVRRLRAECLPFGAKRSHRNPAS